jgi:hypothetical protein
MDETAIRIRGKSTYLYRAVDKHGKSVASLLREDRGIEAAQAFFRKAVATQQSRWPSKVTLDGHAASHRALRLLREEDPKWQSVVVRSCRYLNNIVEQDHRAIKRRCQPMLGFKSVETAAVTLSGIELAHRIHKQQFNCALGQPRRNLSLKERWDRVLAQSLPFDSAQYRFPLVTPPMQQNSTVRTPAKTKSYDFGVRRYARKIFDGRGLYMLVTPNGGRYWRYNYRFEGKLKTVALGIHPDVPLERARVRHQVARSLLAEGIDPSARKRALGIRAFATTAC